MFLQIIDAAGGVRHIDLAGRDGEWLLGRSENCDIVLAENSISRKHAKLFGGPETFFITDLGSGIGTHNQHGPITSATEFAAGDTVSIGSFKLRLVPIAAAPAPAQTVQTQSTARLQAGWLPSGSSPWEPNNWFLP